MQINVKEIKNKLDNGEQLMLIDVRSRPEYHSERVDTPCLCNQPLDKIEALSADKSATLYLLCQTGHRSQQAQERLLDAGYHKVISITGGLDAWKREQYPITKTPGSFPIIRQVQIAAGALVLAGSVAAITVNPTWMWLPAFVGAGIVMAGITGYCGMALMLARMPWNKSMQSS